MTSKMVPRKNVLSIAEGQLRQGDVKSGAGWKDRQSDHRGKEMATSASGARRGEVLHPPPSPRLALGIRDI